MARDRADRSFADTSDDEPDPVDEDSGRATRLWERVSKFVTPDIPPPKDRSKKADIRNDMEASPQLAEFFLQQSRLRYDDVFKRAENVERRAGTLQSSVVFAVTLTLTGGALLLDKSKVTDEWWRRALGLLILVGIGCFVWAGIHATWASTRTRRWKVAGKPSLHGGSFASLQEAQLARAAAYVYCLNQNTAINSWKAAELSRALRAFVAGLIVLIALAAGLVLYAATTTEESPSGSRPPATSPR